MCIINKTGGKGYSLSSFSGVGLNGHQ
jgi:hypothetical protein